MAYISAVKFSQLHSDQITIRRCGRCTLRINSLTDNDYSTMDMEIDLEGQRVRVKVGTGLPYKVKRALCDTVQLPGVALAKIVPDNVASVVVDLNNRSHGWMVGYYASSSANKKPRFTKLTDTQAETLLKVQNGELFTLRGDRSNARKPEPGTKDYAYKPGTSCIKSLLATGMIRFASSPEHPGKYYPVEITEKGRQALENIGMQ